MIAWCISVLIVAALFFVGFRLIEHWQRSAFRDLDGAYLPEDYDHEDHR